MLSEDILSHIKLLSALVTSLYVIKSILVPVKINTILAMAHRNIYGDSCYD